MKAIGEKVELFSKTGIKKLNDLIEELRALQVGLKAQQTEQGTASSDNQEAEQIPDEITSDQRIELTVHMLQTIIDRNNLGYALEMLKGVEEAVAPINDYLQRVMGADGSLIAVRDGATYKAAQIIRQFLLNIKISEDFTFPARGALKLAEVVFGTPQAMIDANADLLRFEILQYDIHQAFVRSWEQIEHLKQEISACEELKRYEDFKSAYDSIRLEYFLNSNNFALVGFFLIEYNEDTINASYPMKSEILMKLIELEKVANLCFPQESPFLTFIKMGKQCRNEAEILAMASDIGKFILNLKIQIAVLQKEELHNIVSSDKEISKLDREITKLKAENIKLNKESRQYRRNATYIEENEPKLEALRAQKLQCENTMQALGDILANLPSDIDIKKDPFQALLRIHDELPKWMEKLPDSAKGEDLYSYSYLQVFELLSKLTLGMHTALPEFASHAEPKALDDSSGPSYERGPM